MTADVPIDQLGRRLTTGEAVGVLVDVGRDLVALHTQGRGHGSAGRLLVGPDGRVRLGEAATGGAPEVDVLDLGRAVEVRLGHDVPDLLRRLLATCRCPDPAGRPTADELVALALRIATPTPVRLPRARPRTRWLAGVVGAVAALALAVALGRAWGPGAGQPTALQTSAPVVAATSPTVVPSAVAPSAHVSSPAVRPARTDWTAVLAAHDRARRQVWTSGRGGQLTAADAPGSPAERRDRALLHGLRERGVVARGWQARIDRVSVVSSDAERVRLRVRDRLAAYRLVTPDGTTRHRAAARGPHWWLVELREVDGHWLTWSTLPTKPA